MLPVAQQNYIVHPLLVPDWSALTSVDQNRRVTIPDNGAYCLFVDLSGNIRRIDLTGSPFTQTTIYNRVAT